MIKLTAEDTHILALVAKPPSEWGASEMSAVDIAKLAVAVHAAALASMSIVAQAAGIDIRLPADVNAVSAMDFGQMAADELVLHRNLSSDLTLGA